MMSPASTGVTVGRDDVRADGQEVACLVLTDHHGLAGLRVHHGESRTRARVASLDDDTPGKTGHLVVLLLHGHALDDVAVGTTPLTSVRIGMAYGSHSASMAPFSTVSWPSSTLTKLP